MIIGYIYIYIYICDVHLCYRIYIETTCIYNLPMSPTSIGRVAAMIRIFGSVSNLPLLIIGDYYYHSHDKTVNRNGDRTGIWYGYWWV